MTVLTVYLVLLCAVPSGLTLNALGSVGRPATLWGLGCALWWICHQLQRTQSGARRRQPVRLALAVSIAMVILTYAVAQARGMPIEEASPADAALLRLASWSGVLLVANDGIVDRDRLRTLLHRLVLTAGWLAALGLLQFFTGQSWIAAVSIPGFSNDLAMNALQSRGGYNRPSATAIHPLEYAAVLAAALPLSITLALQARPRPRGQPRPLSSSVRPWLATGVMAMATVLSVSRSAPLGAVTGLLVLLPTWPRKVRRRVYAGIAVLLMSVYVAIPGFLAAFTSLFTGMSKDSSTLSRTSSYDLAIEISGRYLLLGRGLGTFLPAYRILDNQYLQTLIEVGVLGLAAFLALVLAAAIAARTAGRFGDPDTDQPLGNALLASTASLAVLFAFFDGLSFPMAAGMLFLLLGLCGAARNVLAVRDQQDRGAAAVPARDHTTHVGRGERASQEQRTAARLHAHPSQHRGQAPPGRSDSSTC